MEYISLIKVYRVYGEPQHAVATLTRLGDHKRQEPSLRPFVQRTPCHSGILCCDSRDVSPD